MNTDGNPQTPRTGRGGLRKKPALIGGTVLLAALASLMFSLRRPPENGRNGAGFHDPAREGMTVQSKSGGTEEAVNAWLETVWALEGARAPRAGESSVISLSAHPSPEREVAFQKLLAGLTVENAAETYRLLKDHAAGDSTVMMETEWRDFLERWGKLNGAGAAEPLAAEESGLQTKIPALLRGWAGTNPREAAAWLLEREKIEERKRAEAEALANPRPEAGVEDAVTFLHEMNDSITARWNIGARRELVLGWLETDLDAPAHWLNENRSGPAGDAAAEAFAGKAAELDLAGALAWAVSIKDSSWRASALDTVGRHWLKEDPDAALAALQEAGCSPETINSMMTDREPGVDLVQAAGAGLSGGKDGNAAGIFISEPP